MPLRQREDAGADGKNRGESVPNDAYDRRKGPRPRLGPRPFYQRGDVQLIKHHNPEYLA